MNGTLEVDGDIIQNGSAYETHAEQVFSKNDLIVTREDAIGGIAAGQLSGIRVKKYDGVSDLNLGVDAAGIMRVGDLGSEQPLATREEAANMTSGALVKWDGVNNRMIAPASNAGDDLKPIKIVNGEAVAVTNDLVSTVGNQDIDGQKRFMQAINIAGPSNLFTSVIFPERDSTNNQTGIMTTKTNGDFASLYVRIDDGGNAQVFVVKVVGGVATSQNILSW